MANLIYDSFKEYLGDGTLNMNTNTFKIVLLTSSYTPSSAHSLYSHLTNQLSTGDGYTAGGATLAKAVGDKWTRSGGTVTFSADNPSWTSATFTCRYAVIYSDTPVSPAKPLVCLFDFGSDQSVSAGTFTIQFNVSGILTLS
jgi:hypothetical protein